MNALGKTKQKVKKVISPIIASCFFFAVVLILSLDNNLITLMGNSVVSNYICPVGYVLENNSCTNIIKATKLGDVNLDGDVNNLDIDVINEYLNKKILFVNINFNAADINKDGVINVLDIKRLSALINNPVISYVCPDDYVLVGNKCYFSKKSIALKKNSFTVGDGVFYNNSYWFVISDHEDYVTLLKQDNLKSSSGDDNISYCDNCNSYDESNIKKMLTSYISNIENDLKEVNGYKIRLITIDELKKLGFHNNFANYYEGNDVPYWLGFIDDYWVLDSKLNSFVVVNYNGNLYAYERVFNSLAQVRPVINLYKNKIK